MTDTFQLSSTAADSFVAAPAENRYHEQKDEFTMGLNNRVIDFEYLYAVIFNLYLSLTHPIYCAI